ncbi:MAG: UrcA family protein [Sphingomonas phyllosphaerae]
MNRFDRAALTALLTLAFSSSPALAQPDRVTFTARVAVNDLNLATVAGQYHFRQRARRAAIKVCGHPFDIRDRFDVLRCQAEMGKDAQLRLAALTHARGVELAAITRR